jgi:hypothetical protein
VCDQTINDEVSWRNLLFVALSHLTDMQRQHFLKPDSYNGKK